MLLPFIRAARADFKWSYIRSSFIAGLMLVTIANVSVAYAEIQIDSGMVALIVGGTPFWMVMIKRFYFKDRSDPIGWSKVLAAGVGFVGLYLLVATPTANQQTFDPIRIGLLMLGSLTWAYGSIALPRMPRHPNTYVQNAYTMLGGGLICFILSAILDPWSNFHLQQVSPTAIYSLAYLVTFGSLLAFSCYIWLCHHASPFLLGSYAFINPLIAVGLGALAGEQSFTPQSLQGATLIITSLVGLCLIEWRNYKTRLA